MQNPPTSASSSIGKRHYSLPDNFPERAILAAVKGQSCPICLENLLTHRRRAAVISSCNHGYCLPCIRKWSQVKRSCPLCNADFDSLLILNASSRRFRKLHLPLLPEHHTSTYNQPSLPRPRRVNSSSSSWRRSRALPWRRSFGRRGCVPDHVIFERKLLWRARLVFDVVTVSQVNEHTKVRIIERIEPWMRREFQAVLGDPDPSIILHFASALFIKRLERENTPQSGHGGGGGIVVEEDQVSSSLGIFLGDEEDIFWHELRCFAESSLTMETYDAVVEYNEVE
ncbi:unnamed protein product [Eruca vesicaria subsp. sativa]|uniref:RING-type E3 ubiquitin transferase n=1 Tax=Eruca vesicaria subsp. sativa TaxID=29727 RepID=A0ABC8L5H5_ERUVS|nr:unnamed protein product [Eruca vesicaria subsp. sativa]